MKFGTNVGMEQARVLLVVDDEQVRRAVARLLALLGHAVSQASTVAEAMGMLDGHDVAVVDLNLPDGLGSQVTAAIRAQGRPIRTALFTGRPGPGLSDCCDVVFSKHDGVDEMTQWVGGARE